MKTLFGILLVLALALGSGGCDESTTSPCWDCPGTRSSGRYTQVVEQSFPAGANPLIRVDNFTGRVVFRTGEEGVIRVVATRVAERRAHFDRIDIDMASRDGGLVIQTENLDNLKNAAVDLVITAPPGATPRLFTAVGDIRYAGRPTGNCRFWSAVGSVRLELMSDVNIRFELRAAVGRISIDLSAHDVIWSGAGSVTGRIGSGGEGYLLAGAAVGSIRVSGR